MNLSYRLLNDLALKYRNSFYLFHENAFLHNYKLMIDNFRSIYRNTHIAYSYKTNYLPCIGKLVYGAGGFAEVTSAAEYEIAKKIEIPGSRIILNGPIHENTLLEQCITTGCMVNADGFSQLSQIKRICDQYPDVQFKIGLRLNIKNTEKFISRFGFSVRDGAATKAVKFINNLHNCQIAGLHTHYWLPGRKPVSFAERLTEMASFAKEHQIISNLEYLNIGGSMYGPMTSFLKNQFSDPIPTFEEYTQIIGKAMKFHFPDEKTTLFVEPGISLVGNTLDFICQVVDLKSIGKTHFAVVSGSVHNVKPSLHPFNLQVQTFAKTPDLRKTKNYQIAGYTCLEYDILRKNLRTSLGIGDFLCFRNVGGYTITMKPPFIKGAPAIVKVSDNDLELVRRTESFDDWFGTFVV